LHGLTLSTGHNIHRYSQLSDLFDAPVAFVSSPKKQFDAMNSMRFAEQLTQKLQPKKDNPVIFIVVFMGSTSCEWTNQNMRSLDPATIEETLHSGGFDCHLTKCETYEQHLKEHHVEFARLPKAMTLRWEA